MLVAELRTRWLSSLAVDGTLPERTVIVRNEAVAHAWRRDLAEVAPALLIGTRFITSIAAARALLEAEGVTFSMGEEAVRAARIIALLGEELPFQGFDQQVLREKRGWGDAIAAAIGDVDNAELGPAALRDTADPRCVDVALLLERVDALAATSWTAIRVLREG